MNNILDKNGENNFLFLASVIAHLCEKSPIVMDLAEIEKYWSGSITRLQYDIHSNGKGGGAITFSLRDKEVK